MLCERRVRYVQWILRDIRVNKAKTESSTCVALFFAATRAPRSLELKQHTNMFGINAAFALSHNQRQQHQT